MRRVPAGVHPGRQDEAAVIGKAVDLLHSRRPFARARWIFAEDGRRAAVFPLILSVFMVVVLFFVSHVSNFQ